MSPTKFSNLSTANAPVLDVWLRGSVLIRGALKIQNLNSKSESKPLILANFDPNFRLFGPANDDWFRLQVNLASLLFGDEMDSSSKWDSIVFEDISGQGFDIFIDKMHIVPSFFLAEVDEKNNKNESPILITAAAAFTNVVPLYGGNITAQDANSPSPVIARLRPGVSTAQVLALCKELTGAGGRFNGSCTLQSALDDTTSTSTNELKAQDLDAPVEWPYLAITASSERDLKAMRNALQEMVEYFDRDKEATIFIGNRKLAVELTAKKQGMRGVKKKMMMVVEVPEEEEQKVGAAPAVEANDVTTQAYCSGTPWK
jgi:hypothetical protein